MDSGGTREGLVHRASNAALLSALLSVCAVTFVWGVQGHFNATRDEAEVLVVFTEGLFRGQSLIPIVFFFLSITVLVVATRRALRYPGRSAVRFYLACIVSVAAILWMSRLMLGLLLLLLLFGSIR
jgi:hypothetical protein